MSHVIVLGNPKVGKTALVRALLRRHKKSLSSWLPPPPLHDAENDDDDDKKDNTESARAVVVPPANASVSGVCSSGDVGGGGGDILFVECPGVAKYSEAMLDQKYDGYKMCIIVIDFTSRSLLANLASWIDIVQQRGCEPEKICVVLNRVENLEDSVDELRDENIDLVKSYCVNHGVTAPVLWLNLRQDDDDSDDDDENNNDDGGDDEFNNDMVDALWWMIRTVAL